MHAAAGVFILIYFIRHIITNKQRTNESAAFVETSNAGEKSLCQYRVLRCIYVLSVYTFD